MKKDTKSNLVMFASGLVCTTVAMVILVNSDSRLKVRAQRQMSQFLDTTGRFISVFEDLADRLVGADSKKDRATEEASNQWIRVEKAREKSHEA